MADAKQTDRRRLLIDLVPGQRLSLQGQVDSATVELVHKTGRVARLCIQAPSTVSITKLQAPAPAQSEHG